jgi:hypothetical protein
MILFRILLLALLCQFFSCAFDTNIPLENDLPSPVDIAPINRNLIYPDSLISILSISDLNDKSLHINPTDCIFPLEKNHNNSGFFLFHPLDTAYTTKHIELLLKSSLMGNYSGNFLISDNHNGRIKLPFNISLQFKDLFDSYPLSKTWWSLYKDNDSNIGFDYIDRKLLFEIAEGESETQTTTGLRSKFKLVGDFSTIIDFNLREDMRDGFEFGFFVSTSPDTGMWSGSKAGFFISGNNGSVIFQCKSTMFQSFSLDTSKISSGTLKLVRNQDQLSFFFYRNSTSSQLFNGPPLISFSFKSADSLYVHLRFVAKDGLKERYCMWNNFSVQEGLIAF